jgi:hypothetical protein
MLSQEGLGCCASPYTSNRICDWLRRYGWEVVNLTVQISRLVGVHLFVPLQVTDFFYACSQQRDKCSVSTVTTWRSDVYHLLPVSYKYLSVAVRVHFSSS